METINTWLSSFAVFHLKLSIQVLIWTIPWAIILFIIHLRKGTLRSIAWLLILCTIPLLPLVSGRYLLRLSPLVKTIPEKILFRSSSTQPREGPSQIVVPAAKAQDTPIPSSDLEKTSAVEMKNSPGTMRIGNFTYKITIEAILGVFLAFGLFVMLIRLASSFLALRNIYRKSQPIDDSTFQSLFGELKVKMNIRRQVKVRVSSFIQGPSSFGVFRPAVLFPTGFLNSQSDDSLEPAIIHELAHIRRHDFLISLFISLVRAFYFYNPAVWYATRQLYLQQEFTCDDWVLSTGCGRKRYDDGWLRRHPGYRSPTRFHHPFQSRYCARKRSPSFLG